MIKNDKQFQITKKLLADFEKSLKDILEIKGDYINPILKKIEIEALESQIFSLKKEMEEYDLLRHGEVNSIRVESIEQIPESLIKGRIIKGWTHADLAGRLQLKEQQIQRYENCNYSTASLARISQIAEALSISVHPFKVIVRNNKIFHTSSEVKNDQIDQAFEKVRVRKSLLTF